MTNYKILSTALLSSLALFSTTAGAEDNQPPEGFTALFNGQDMTGWKADPLSTRPSHGSGKEKEETVREEVVIEMAGEAELASGRNELLLIHHNIVDGVLDRLRFGVSTAEADAAKPTSGK